jgi:hypothetical protein
MRVMTERQAVLAEEALKYDGMTVSQRWAEPGEVFSVLLHDPRTGDSVQIEWDR